MVDTRVFSARLLRRASALDDLYLPMLASRPAVISFQTAAEVRHGAIKGGWGPARLRRLEVRLAEVDIAWPGPELVVGYAQLRADCERVGHALGQRIHDADRWIAATAIRLGLPLVAHDRVFRHVPGLILETALPG
ncbi:MAG: PIN domain-containing protein [Acidimicrobiales bacterium]